MNTRGLRIRKQHPLFRATAFIVLVVFSVSPIASYAQDLMWMPPPGVRVSLSPEFNPAVLKGITIHPDNPLQFDFLIDQGDAPIPTNEKEDQYRKLVKYFLAALTMPEEDMWVNLSPYEKDRIIEDNFGKTEMGRDLLSQDYILKQITASLIYPEEELGKAFWDKIYKLAYEKYGSTDIPVNTFNKVWIVPDVAEVYESGDTAFVLKSHLKVMLEQDYVAMSNQKDMTPSSTLNDDPEHSNNGMSSRDVNALGSQIVRELIIPELEKEINQGKNFALLRQIYSGMILATWYKKALKESLLGQIYADKKKMKGVGLDGQGENASLHIENIYQQYIAAFKKGTYNYIKEDYDKYTQETIPRKYVSGGMTLSRPGPDHAMLGFANDTLKRFRAGLDSSADAAAQEYARAVTSGLKRTDRAMVAFTEGPEAKFIENANTKLRTTDRTTDAAMISSRQLADMLESKFLSGGERSIPIALAYPNDNDHVQSTERLSELIRLFKNNEKLLASSRSGVVATFDNYQRKEGLTPSVYIEAADLGLDVTALRDDAAMLLLKRDVPTFIQMLDIYVLMQDPSTQDAMGELANRTYETLIAKNAAPAPLLNGTETKEDRDKKLMSNLAPFDAIKDQLELFSMRNQRALMRELATIPPADLSEERLIELQEKYKTRPMDILENLVSKINNRQDSDAVDADLQELAKQANAAWASRQVASRRGRPVFRPWSLLSVEEVEKDYIFLDQFLPEFLKLLQGKVEQRYSIEQRAELNSGMDAVVEMAQNVASMKGKPLTARQADAIKKSAQMVMEIFSIKKRKDGDRPYFVHQIGVAREALKNFQFDDITGALINLLHHDDREDVPNAFEAYKNYIRRKLTMEADPDSRTLREAQINGLLLAVRLLSKLEVEQFTDMDENGLLIEYFKRLADPRSYYPPYEHSIWYTDGFIHDTQLIKLSDILFNVGDMEALFANDRLSSLSDAEQAKVKGFPAKTYRKLFMAIDYLVAPTVFLSGQEKQKFFIQLEEKMNGYIAKYDNKGEGYVSLFQASRDALQTLNDYKTKIDFATTRSTETPEATPLMNANHWRNRFLEGPIVIPDVVKTTLSQMQDDDILIAYQAYSEIVYTEGRVVLTPAKFAQRYSESTQERAKSLFSIAEQLLLAENQHIDQDQLIFVTKLFRAMAGDSAMLSISKVATLGAMFIPNQFMVDLSTTVKFGLGVVGVAGLIALVNMMRRAGTTTQLNGVEATIQAYGKGFSGFSKLDWDDARVSSNASRGVWGGDISVERQTIENNLIAVINEDGRLGLGLTAREIARKIFELTYADQLDDLSDRSLEEQTAYASALAAELQDIAATISDENSNRPFVAQVYEHLRDMIRIVPQMYLASVALNMELVSEDSSSDVLIQQLGSDARVAINYAYQEEYLSWEIIEETSLLKQFQVMGLKGLVNQGALYHYFIDHYGKNAKEIIGNQTFTDDHSIVIKSIVDKEIPASRRTAYYLLLGNTLNDLKSRSSLTLAAYFAAIFTTLFLILSLDDLDINPPSPGGSITVQTGNGFGSYFNSINQLLLKTGLIDRSEIDEAQKELNELYVRYERASKRLDGAQERFNDVRTSAALLGVTIENMDNIVSSITDANDQRRIAAVELRKAQDLVNQAYREQIDQHIQMLNQQKYILNVVIVKINNALTQQRDSSVSVMDQMKQQLIKAQQAVAELERKVAIVEEGLKNIEIEDDQSAFVVPNYKVLQELLRTNEEKQQESFTLPQIVIEQQNSTAAIMFHTLVIKETTITNAPSPIVQALIDKRDEAQRKLEAAQSARTKFLKRNKNTKGAGAEGQMDQTESRLKRAQEKRIQTQADLDAYQKAIGGEQTPENKGIKTFRDIQTPESKDKAMLGTTEDGVKILKNYLAALPLIVMTACASVSQRPPSAYSPAIEEREYLRDQKFLNKRIRNLERLLREDTTNQPPATIEKPRSDSNVGGIDFNSASLNLQIKRDGQGVPLPMNMQNIDAINLDGFIPVILDISPVTNLPVLLGANDAQAHPQLSMN